jgi:hypothetical protein
MLLRTCVAVALLAACASADPFNDLVSAQHRLDARGIGFGVTRVPGHDAFVFQIRFATSDTESEPNADPMAAAQAAAPEGCTVRSVTPESDGGSYRAEYDC